MYIREKSVKICEDIYGGFVEHLGRNVYGGIYDPASPFLEYDPFAAATVIPEIFHTGKICIKSIFFLIFIFFYCIFPKFVPSEKHKEKF